MKKTNKSSFEQRSIQFFSDVILNSEKLANFAMSEELAKAIGTVVVQALTENAKDAMSSGLDEDLDDGGLEDMDLGESDLPESKRDAGKVQEAEGPKAAPDLSQDFAELKATVNNHSELTNEAMKHYRDMKLYFSKN